MRQSPMHCFECTSRLQKFAMLSSQPETPFLWPMWQAWMDPDMDPTDGIDERSQHAMLRLDAMVMRVQLNVRFLLEVG